ncbi:MAG: LysR family transcriptional regulator [Rhizobiales bacterium]|nr:LysR family transcriptional regulator [Hyphomicrobiales bacterium]
MDWDHARVFLAAARAGQFLAAARQLGLDHATVGRRIGALERDLGARLFERRTNGCVLTPAGETFVAAAEQVEAQMLRVQADLAATGLETAGTVRIGAPDGFGTLFLAPRLGRLAERHPALTIQLAPLPRTFSLSRREADIAVVIERPQEGRLVVRKLTDYALGFYASRDYLARAAAPQSEADLTAHTLVTYVQDLIFSPVLHFMPELFGPRFRRFECASAVAQGEAVRAGAGVGILHDYAARGDERLVRVLPGLRFDRTYWLVTHADTRDLLRVRATADFIAAEVAAARQLFAPSP